MHTSAVARENPIILRAESIKKEYAGRRVLTSANITLLKGRLTALVGQAGSGKSTFLNICSGLTPSDGGTLTYMGSVIGSGRSRLEYDKMARRGVYIVVANGTAIPSRTIREHFRDLQKYYGGRDTSDIVHALGLESLLDSPLRALSGGERKLANLAIAAARTPALLLIDEPFDALAPLVIERVGDLLRTLANEGCSILMAGQKPQNLLDYADDVAWLVAGRIHGLGSPTQARMHERFQGEYNGGRPYN